jgi:hypothetical protein
MSLRSVRLGLGCLLVAGVCGGAAPATAPAAAPAGLGVSVSRAHVSNRLGDSFSFSSKITNTGPAPVSGLVAHLNVVSLTRGVYVDPEDWSSHRTQYVAPLAPGHSADLSWRVKSVNGGDFAIYVVVLPGKDPARAPPGLAVSPAVDVHVTEQRTLNSGGVLPLALGIPGLLGVAALGVQRRRRRAG